MMRAWRFKRYENDLTKGFGFDGALQSAGIGGEYLLLDASITQRSATRLAVSLSLLLRTLRWMVDPVLVDHSRLQLMELEGHVRPGEYLQAAPIGGYASFALADWVERTYAVSVYVPEVAEAVWLACRALGVSHLRRQEGMPNPFDPCQCRIGRRGSFFLDTVGNACSVDAVDWEHRREGQGYEIAPHNTDSAAQQFSLYAGLAMLLTLAARDIDPR